MDWKTAKETLPREEFVRLVFARQREAYAAIQRERDEYLATASDDVHMRHVEDVLALGAMFLPKTPEDWLFYESSEGSLAAFKRRIEGCRERLLTCPSPIS